MRTYFPRPALALLVIVALMISTTFAGAQTPAPTPAPRPCPPGRVGLPRGGFGGFFGGARFGGFGQQVLLAPQLGYSLAPQVQLVAPTVGAVGVDPCAAQQQLALAQLSSPLLGAGLYGDAGNVVLVQQPRRLFVPRRGAAVIRQRALIRRGGAFRGVRRLGLAPRIVGGVLGGLFGF